MSSKGAYAAAVMPRQGGDRFYNPPAVRRHQQILLEQQQQVMLMRRQLAQQQWHVKSREAVRTESSSEAEPESVNDVDDSARVLALSVPRPLGTASAVNVTNLDRLMESVTPFVEARCLSEVNTRGRRWRTREFDSTPFYYLEDLWDSFNEWSVYGAGVPLLLYGREPIEQFYVPFLSGIQVYMDRPKPSYRTRVPGEDNDGQSYRLTSGVGSNDSEGDRRGRSVTSSNTHRPNRLSLVDRPALSSASDEEENSPGLPLFQFLEHEQPYNRRPLSDKISLLLSQFPELSKCRSTDLHPSSWISVAWYPIYRIPVGPTLQDLDASFLTFHFLSTQPRANQPALFHAPSTRTTRGILDPTPRISLPVFALAAYKLKGSIVSPSGPHECEQEDSLSHAAEKWLRDMQVTLPDYEFFRTHSPRR